MKLLKYFLLLLIPLSLTTTIRSHSNKNKNKIIYVATSDNEIVEIERWKIDEMKTLLVLLEKQRNTNSYKNPLPATMIDSESLQLVSNALSYIAARDFTFFYKNLVQQDMLQLKQGQTVLSLEDGKVHQLLTAAERLQAMGVNAFCLSYIMPPEVQKVLLNPYLITPINAMMPVIDEILKEHPDTVTAVAISPDNTQFVSSSYGTKNNLILWDISNPQAITFRVLIGHPENVNAVSFNAAGTKIISGSEGTENNLILWDSSDIHPHILQGHPDSVTTVGFSPDGTKIFSGSEGQQNNLKIWDLSNPEITSQTLVGHADGVTEIQCSPDGTKIVSIGVEQNNPIIWDITDPAKIVQHPLVGHPATVSTVAFINNATVVSGCDGQQSNLIVWNISNLDNITNQVLQGHSDKVTTVAVSPDGTQFASGSLGTQNNLILWIITDQGLIPYHLIGHSGAITTATFNSTGTKLASSCWGQPDDNFIVWNINNPNAITHRMLTGHPRSLKTIVFNHDDTQIIAGSRDTENNLIIHKFLSVDEKRTLQACSTAHVRFIYQLCLAKTQGLSLELTSPYAKTMFMRLAPEVQKILEKRLDVTVQSELPQAQESGVRHYLKTLFK